MNAQAENKEDNLIMVIKRELLFGKSNEHYFQGFMPCSVHNFEAEIMEKSDWIKRGFAEHNLIWKQPIGYTMIVNPGLEKVFAYKRDSKACNYGEKRLQGKWSVGVGGHIQKEDNKNGCPIIASIIRELNEEVKLVGEKNIKYAGSVNDDSDNVGRVHFGMIYVLKTEQDEIKLIGKENAIGEFKAISELKEICNSADYEVEGWSRILLECLEEYF